MEPIELSRSNWIFIILAVMLFSFVSCTKDDLDADQEFSADTMHVLEPVQHPEPTDFQR